MKRIISVDPGKFSTKVDELDIQKKCISNEFPIRTKVSAGDFRDDAIEAKTVIVEIDGNVYKVGNGARGEGATLDTNKMTEEHKILVITAIASLVSANEKDEVYAAIGLPAKEWANVSKRMDYKEYILPLGDYEVKIKTKSTAPVVTKKFKVVQTFIYPESLSALFMDQMLYNITPSTITGVIDIGNLNLNATLWQGTELIEDKTSTAELGGSILIQELSQEISSNICTCDELITANILKLPPEQRHLPDDLNLSKEQVEESAKLIKRVLREHAEKIKRVCRARNWSLDVTRVVAIGGTSQDIEAELREVFGENLIVLPDPTFVNARGYMRMMCAQIPEIGEIVSLEKAPVENKKEKSA